MLVAGVLAHTFVIGMETMEVGQVPVGDATSAISMFVWLLAVAYLYTEVTTDERAMGVFILPLLIALQLIPALKPADAEVHSPVLRGPLFGIHVSSLLLAYASFALACVIGITYVLLFKEIKAKHLGFFYARIPSLQVLDKMNQRAIIFGWIFLTVGILSGVAFAFEALAHPVSAGVPAGAGDVGRGSENHRRARLLGGVFLRALRRAANRLGRPPGGVPVGARLRHRAAELRADQLFLYEES